MAIYSNIKLGFRQDLPVLPNILHQSVAEKLGGDSREGEILSRENSLRYMVDEVKNKEIPNNAHDIASMGAVNW